MYEETHVVIGLTTDSTSHHKGYTQSLIVKIKE